MGIQQCILVLFLLLFAVVRASSDLYKVESEITSESTLEKVDQVLKGIRGKFKGNTDVGLVEINDNALAVLFFAGYSVKHYLLYLVDNAIEGNHYDFLESLFPADKMKWWRADSDVVLLLAKAFGRKEWMSMEEWRKYGNAIDWKLHFRSLISSKNIAVYKDKEFRDIIFENELFWGNFRKIVQEAYDSKNFAFLEVIPYPSDKRLLGKGDDVFFWLLAYGESWCSKEWSNSIDNVEDFDEVMKWSNIFERGNPSVFKCEKIKEFLGKHEDFSETLETAIEYDSLSFALYLEEKYGQEKFQEMVDNCSVIYTLSRTLQHYPLKSREVSLSYRKVSRVYNLLLKKGKQLDVNAIEAREVPILDEEYLQPLLDGGFWKTPLILSRYGKTKTGNEFLKKILKKEFPINGNPVKLPKYALTEINLEVPDIELFRLIDEELATESEELQQRFRKRCAQLAIGRGDIDFLIDAALFPAAVSSAMAAVFHEAVMGNLTVLDWIFGIKHELLEEFVWGDSWWYSSLPQVPLLRFLFKKSERIPSYEFLAKYANNHFLQAIKDEDQDYYDLLISIEGIDRTMRKHGLEIPRFPRKSNI